MAELGKIKEDHAARGERMKALRVASGFSSLDKMAEATGVSRQEVIRIENGKNRFTSPRVQQGYANAIGVPIGAVAEYARGKLDLGGLLRLRSVTRSIERETRYPQVGEWIRELRAGAESEDLVAAFEAEIADYKSETGPTASELQEALRRARRKLQGRDEDVARRLEIRRLIAETEIDHRLNKKPNLSSKKAGS